MLGVVSLCNLKESIVPGRPALTLPLLALCGCTFGETSCNDQRVYKCFQQDDETGCGPFSSETVSKFDRSIANYTRRPQGPKGCCLDPQGWSIDTPYHQLAPLNGPPGMQERERSLDDTEWPRPVGLRLLVRFDLVRFGSMGGECVAGRPLGSLKGLDGGHRGQPGAMHEATRGVGR